MAKKIQESKLPSKTKLVSGSKTPKLTVIPGGQLNNFINAFSEKLVSLKKSKTVYIVLIITGLLLLSIYKKSWFIAATVNNSPVTNLDLQMRLNQQYRNKTLNALVNERIILDEARKKQAVPSKDEVDKRIAEIEEYYGGKEAFKMWLVQQGETIDNVRSQVMPTLALTKLYEKEATVTAEEVAEFIEANQNQLEATDAAAQQKLVYDSLKNQKLEQILLQRFQQLRQKAKIQIF